MAADDPAHRVRHHEHDVEVTQDPQIDLIVEVAHPPVLRTPRNNWKRRQRSMRRRDQLHLVEAPENQAVQIRLVAVRMEDVDLLLPQQRQQLAECADVELEALVDGVERLTPSCLGALVEVELRIVGALQIGDRHVECIAIGLERREQDRLLRPAAAAAAAAHIKHVDLSGV